jgi:hypothetical protein
VIGWDIPDLDVLSERGVIAPAGRKPKRLSASVSEMDAAIASLAASSE